MNILTSLFDSVNSSDAYSESTILLWLIGFAESGLLDIFSDDLAETFDFKESYLKWRGALDLINNSLLSPLDVITFAFANTSGYLVQSIFFYSVVFPIDLATFYFTIFNADSTEPDFYPALGLEFNKGDY